MNDPYTQSGQDTGALGRLIAALRRLPGVGPKSAKRMAYHLMERDRPGAKEIAEALLQAAERIHHCERCRNLTEEKLCHICASPRRDPAKLCIVESPTDLHSIEEAGIYNGRYFVLMGHLSPLDGIGPDELGMDQLQALLEQGDIEEVVLATNLTVEGEATAHFISEMVHARKIDVTRIAHGVPVGGELEYIDSSTLSQAFTGRRKI